MREQELLSLQIVLFTWSLLQKSPIKETIFVGERARVVLSLALNSRERDVDENNSCKLQVSFAEYSLFYRALLQKRPVILSLLQKRPCKTCSCRP